ncbi:MAG: lamin tail domain-containing protein [Draconibacterium sp.]
MLLIVNVMFSNLPKFLILIILLINNTLTAHELWRESFDVPGKGIWGIENETIQSDFAGVTKWSLNYSNVKMQDVGDYAKTVSTSGGRFEVVDIDGEITWISEIIDISDYIKAEITLTASETGSNTNANTKYLKAFYKLDNGMEQPFAVNSSNSGNWGSVVAEQKDLAGKQLQIIVKMANNYGADKVILDEVVVTVEEKPAEPILPGEIVINEVMFNPKENGSDYLEIYNISAKTIDLKRLKLASRTDDLELTQVYQLTGSKQLFEPGGFLALTKDTAGVFPYFSIQCKSCFLQMEKFPSFNNDEDFVVLLDENLNVIDELHYTDKLHHPLLADEEGIALERVSFTESTNEFFNWHSAASVAGYGTPGYKNSQGETANITQPQITFSPESFSPDFDGYNDEYQICYALEKPGYVANVSIFDAAGRFVMKLANNEILGSEGKFTWNGEDPTGQKQKLGVYVVLVEIFSLTGETWQFKDGVVLTGK